jgi:hypothetical protein
VARAAPAVATPCERFGGREAILAACTGRVSRPVRSSEREVPGPPVPGLPRIVPGIVRSTRRYWRSAVLIVLGVTAVSAVASYLLEPASASTAIALRSPVDTALEPDRAGDYATARYIEQQAELVVSDAVLDRLVVETGEDVVDLRERITAQAQVGRNVVRIVADAPTRSGAALLANQVVSAYRMEASLRAERQRRTVADGITAGINALLPRAALRDAPEAAAAQEAIAALQQRSVQLDVDGRVFGDGIDFVRVARAEDADGGGVPFRGIAVGLSLGVVVAEAASWLRANRNRLVAVPADAEALLAAPVIGTDIAASRRLIAAALTRRDPPSLVAVLGPAGPERSTSILDVALDAAADGQRLLLLDGLASRSLSAAIASRLGCVRVVSDGPTRSVTVVGTTLDVSVLSRADPQRAAAELRGLVTAYDLVLADVDDDDPIGRSVLHACDVALAIVPIGTHERDVTRIGQISEAYAIPLCGALVTSGASAR